ncbi:MAG: hypothetical protein HOE90_06430 [Bacteriovoracaceae bacterium]|nr:hypothetical protein [Bacteriovoracaceae bacterium]
MPKKKVQKKVPAEKEKGAREKGREKGAREKGARKRCQGQYGMRCNSDFILVRPNYEKDNIGHCDNSYSWPVNY